MKASDLRARDRVLVLVDGAEREARVIQVARERVTGGSRVVIRVRLVGSGAPAKLLPRQVLRIVRAAPRVRSDPRSGLERAGRDDDE